MIRFLALLLLLALPVQAATNIAASTSRTDVNAAIALCSAGDTVIVPAGTNTWTGDISISGISLIGAGYSNSAPTVITAGQVNMTKHSTHTTRMIGFRFTGDNQHFELDGAWTDEMNVVGHCYFYIDSGYLGLVAANGALFYHCEFKRADLSGGNAIHCTLGATAEANTSWGAAHSMGSADTAGDKNIYFEDSIIENFRDGFPDCDDGSRVVVRYCTINDASIITHGGGSGGSGNDSSTYGARHLEVYMNDFNRVLDGPSDSFNQWVYYRGSSGIVASNVMDDADTAEYPNKPEVRLGVGNCSAGYPRQYQVGQSTQSEDATPDNPLLIFGNSGYGVQTISREANPNTTCSNPTSLITTDRDYYLSNQWSWTAYTYPHPLQDAGGSGGGGSSGNRSATVSGTMRAY